MNLFRKYLQRTPAFTALLALLMAVAIAFCAIGFAAWSGARAQFKQVDAQYTTIAVPRGDAFWTGLLYEKKQLTPLTLQTERNYPGLLADDRRGFLMAHVSGCDSLSAYEQNNYSSADFDAYGNSMAVIAVRCSSVTEMDAPIEQAIFDENGEIVDYETVVERSYYANFSLETVVCRLPAYDILPEATEITLGSSLFTADGQVPFAVGKTYLLLVLMKVHMLCRTMNLRNRSLCGRFPPRESTALLLTVRETMEHPGTATMETCCFPGSRSKKERMSISASRRTPFLFTQSISGELQDFLNSDAGKVWQNEIIPMCALNYESASVILTDYVNSLLLFNTGEAGILEGRSFEAEEYADGEAVCLVSAAYALKNNLSVGDTVNLDLYQAELGFRETPAALFMRKWSRCWFSPPVNRAIELGCRRTIPSSEFIPRRSSLPACTAFRQTRF